jgi:signal transduction histidine kinase
MSLPQSVPARPMEQQRRLRTFLRWLITCSAVFAPLECLAFLLFRDAAFGLASLTSAGFLICLLLAQAQLRRGRPQVAAIVLYTAMLVAALIGSVIMPDVLLMLVFLPLLALVVVLPYITGRVLYILIMVGWLVMIGITILDEILPASATAPTWLVSLFRVSSFGAATALLLVLIVQFSNRLVEMLTSTEHTNAELRRIQARLEAQQHDLRTTLQEREAAVALHRAIEERLTALSEAASNLLSLPQQRHVLPAILDLARQVITADAYALWRVHPTLPEWSITHAVGLSESYQQQAARTLNGTRTIPDSVVATPDTEDIPDLMAHRQEEYRQEGIRALLVTPLRIQGQMGGTLVFYYRTPHPFSELELRVATALSHLAAAALTTAELYDEQQRRRQEAEAAQRDQTFLAEASGILGASLDYPATLASIARLVIAQLADWCGIYLLDDAGMAQEVVVAHQDPAKEALARELSRRYPPTPDRSQGLMQVLRTGQPLIAPDFDAAIPAIAEDAEHLRLLQAVGVTSCLLVPLRVGDRIIGVLTCGRSDPQQRYHTQDLPLAQELARRAASAIEHAQLYRTAQDAIRVREQFLSIASHELKTPLTSLMGFADLLQRRTARESSLSERDQRALHAIREQAKRLDQLIGNLLDISRIETGRLRLECVPMDVGDLTQRVVTAFQPTLEQHQMIFRRPDGPLFVDGDALRLEQVMHNLIGNAIKYSPHGGTITVQVAQHAATARIAISDQGLGIPADALPHLFQRFYRASNIDAQYISGMGIGLYVVKEIVALHAGTIEVASQEGLGSTFTVVLPLPESQPLLESLATNGDKGDRIEL